MGQDLIEAMQEALDHSEGKIELRASTLNISPVCEIISPDEIKATRKDLGMTRDVFAVILGVSENTVESWETGIYAPDGSARRLITVLQKDRKFPERYGIINRV
jgi:putative transcriptional regulator